MNELEQAIQDYLTSLENWAKAANELIKDL
jgi:hypothetical protein